MIQFPTTRQEALTVGALYYQTTTPCKRGHVAPRHTKAKYCTACTQARRNENPEATRADRIRDRSTPKGKASRSAQSRRYNARPHGLARREERRQERLKTDPQFRAATALRSRFKSAHQRLRQGKVGSAISDLGCSLAEFCVHIEAQWQSGMSWGNLGSIWQLDHIKALGLFDLTDRSQFIKAAHFTNLQPLFTADHVAKTSVDRKLIQMRKAAVR